MAHPTPPDPLLNPAPGPCAELAAGPDYAAGTDAAGHPVIPADVGAPPVPVPDGIGIPLARTAPGRNRLRPTQGESAYVSLDGAKIAPLLETPGCLPTSKPAHR